MKTVIAIIIVLTFLFLPVCKEANASPSETKGSGLDSNQPIDPDTRIYNNYVTEFKKAATSNLTEEDMNKIFNYYFSLQGMNENSEESEDIEPENIQYSLEKLRKEPFYSTTINTLIKSRNPHKRLFAYITLGATGDKSFNLQLLKAMKRDSSKKGRIWAIMALIYLRDNHPDEIFDQIVRYDHLTEGNIFPAYLAVYKENLEQIAYKKIKSINPIAQLYALTCLAQTKSNPTTEKIVRDCIRSWNPYKRLYAIDVASSLGLGDIKPLVMPYLDNELLRDSSLLALANSPTETDQNYLASLIPTEKEVPKDLLNAYFNSSRDESIRTWLRLIRDNKIPSNYYFFVQYQPLLTEDRFLEDIQDTICKTKNPQILERLPKALNGRNDNKSIEILISLLKNPDSSVRYWAGKALEGTSSQQLISEIPGLLKNPDLRTTALTDLAIENKLDGLQEIYRNILRSDQPPDRRDLRDWRDWKRSAFEYLSTFPQEEERAFFISVLKTYKKRGDLEFKRYAATGLGELKDQNCVDLIEEAIKQEGGNDFNARDYLKALGKIKGDKAKRIIESYKNSEDGTIYDLVSKSLANW